MINNNSRRRFPSSSSSSSSSSFKKRSYSDNPRPRSQSDSGSNSGSGYRGRSFSGSRSRGGGSRSGSRHFQSSGNFKQYIQIAEPLLLTDYTPSWTYPDLDIDPILKKAIAERGYVNPTEIQDLTIPMILSGKDVLGLAATGTGKTAAFLVPLLNATVKKLQDNHQYQSLIIAPTRELALQIEQELLKIIPRNSKIFATTCVGGSDIRRQMKRLKMLNHFIIGTPGRLIDLIDRRSLDITHCSAVVLDEVDRMVDMGFIDDIRYLIDQLPKNRQTLFFSATLNSKLQPLVDSFLTNPSTAAIHSPNASKNVHQDVIKISRGQNKLDTLGSMLETVEWHKVLIFTRTKMGAENVMEFLDRKGLNVESIHGDKTQGARKKALDKFKSGDATILVATDVAARGLDVHDISHVINFDEPEDFETYIHRVGRTGRSGKTGWAFTFVDV